MAKQNNLQLYRGQGIPPANSMLEGEIAMDTDKKVLWINNGQAIKPVGIIEGGTTPPADYAGTLWIDNNASPTGIPADFLVANNLTTQAPGAYVLDAYQGKILKDALDAQQLAISDQADQINNLSEDYIVEQGASGAYTYRKWNSGVSECWLVYTESTATAFTATGNVFWRQIYGFRYPPNLFIDPPAIVASVNMGNVGACQVGAITNESFNVAILSANSTARQATIYAYIKGYWK